MGPLAQGVITEGGPRRVVSFHPPQRRREDIKQYLPKSLEPVFYCAILILIVGVAVGNDIRHIQKLVVDNLIRFISYLGVCTPAYAIGVLLLLVFSYTLGIFPSAVCPRFRTTM
ncbi:MAG: hypothetical protein ACLU9S_04975 [Oscillospiraceae bacterium]